MRLLHTKSGALVSYLGRDAPKYAILSHTWGEEEVTFDDLRNDNAYKKKGYEKLKAACDLAAANGYEHIWIDTVCIDKSSSAELSEAINSMFALYQNADVCYAFLEDVIVGPDGGNYPFEEAVPFINSRWFTRGWTLQELLAPWRLLFYSKRWTLLGDRANLASAVSKATSVDEHILKHRSPQVMEILMQTSVAKRMSWASNRCTTRPEDLAYCLLGLFGVTLPLLYGEGETNAFFRLQEQIFRQYDDQSILAWVSHGFSPYNGGWMASHPRNFATVGSYVGLRSVGQYSLTERGLQIILRTTPPHSVDKGKTYHFDAILDCHIEGDLTGPVTIPMSIESGGLESADRYSLVSISHLPKIIEQARLDTLDLETKRLFIPRNPMLYSTDQQERISYFRIHSWPDELQLIEAYPEHGWNPQSRTFTVKNVFPPRMAFGALYTGTQEWLTVYAHYGTENLVSIRAHQTKDLMRNYLAGWDGNKILDTSIRRKAHILVKHDSAPTVLLVSTKLSRTMSYLVVDMDVEIKALSLTQWQVLQRDAAAAAKEDASRRSDKAYSSGRSILTRVREAGTSKPAKPTKQRFARSEPSPLYHFFKKNKPKKETRSRKPAKGLKRSGN